MTDVATGQPEGTKSFFGKIYRFGEAHGLAILAHTVFGVAAFYFAYLFFEFEISLAFVRNLGVAVTFWASLGLAFNFATINGRTAESSFAGWNVIILATSVLLCLVAMANHKHLLVHTVVVHLVLTLSALWNMLARHYYKSRSHAWNEWFEERFTEDALWWVVYLFAAYLPFYLPPLGVGLTAQSVADASDGATAVVLFWEFFSFWWNTWKQRRVLAKYSAERALATEPLPHEDILSRILSTRTMRVGCLFWPPVVDCALVESASKSGSNHVPTGFYGKWVTAVAGLNDMQVLCFPMAWYDMKHQLESARVDFIISAFITDARREYAAFSKPYHQCSMMGVAHPGPEVWDTKTIRAPDVRIVVAKNEVGFEYARSILGFDPERHDPRFTVVETSRIEEVASIVLGGGKKYLAIADALSIHSIQLRHASELRVVLNDPALHTYDLAVMFAKGQDKLKTWIETEFDRARWLPDIAKAEDELMNELQGHGFFRQIYWGEASA